MFSLACTACHWYNPVCHVHRGRVRNTLYWPWTHSATGQEETRFLVSISARLCVWESHCLIWKSIWQNSQWQEVCTVDLSNDLSHVFNYHHYFSPFSTLSSSSVTNNPHAQLDISQWELQVKWLRGFTAALSHYMGQKPSNSSLLFTNIQPQLYLDLNTSHCQWRWGDATAGSGLSSMLNSVGRKSCPSHWWGSWGVSSYPKSSVWGC